MKYILLALALTIQLASMSFAQESLQGTTVINTGPFASDGAVHSFRWINNTGKCLYIFEAQIQVSCSTPFVQDFWMSLNRTPDNSLVIDGGGNHSNPGDQNKMLNRYFQPNYFELGVGQALILSTAATNNPGGVAGESVQIWYSCDE